MARIHTDALDWEDDDTGRADPDARHDNSWDVPA